MAPSKLHPLTQLSQNEFILARNCVLKHHGSGTSLFFRSIQLQEPKKEDLVPFLVAEHDGSLTESTPRPARYAQVENDIIANTRDYTRTIVNVDKGEVVSKDVLEKNAHPNMAT